MIEFPLLALLGFVVGAGGGFLLVPVLLRLYPGEPPETVTAIPLFLGCLAAIGVWLLWSRSS